MTYPSLALLASRIPYYASAPSMLYDALRASVPTECVSHIIDDKKCKVNK